MLRNRWDDARTKVAAVAKDAREKELAEPIRQFQFRDIRPKAASEIRGLNDASVLRGHTEEEITERACRRVGAIAKPSKQPRLWDASHDYPITAFRKKMKKAP